jgi:hypothetical protein
MERTRVGIQVRGRQGRVGGGRFIDPAGAGNSGTNLYHCPVGSSAQRQRPALVQAAGFERGQHFATGFPG